MSFTKIRIILIATIACLTSASSASAGFLGSTITSQYYAYGTKSGVPSTFTADGGEHARFANYFDVTVTDSQIIYDFHAPVVWSASPVSLDRDGLQLRNGNLLTFLDAPSIIGVAINAASNVGRFSAANVTFNSSGIAVDWAGLSFTSASLIVLDLRTAAPPAVAEPPAYALMLGGLTFAAGFLRKRRRGRA